MKTIYMEAILKKLTLLTNSLLDTNIGIQRNFELLDNNMLQFDKVTRLFKIDNTESVDIITDIVYKLNLQDKNYLNAKYTTLDMAGYLADSTNHLLLLDALNKNYYVQSIATLMADLEILANEGSFLLQSLVAA
jgi:hypothetical protein